MPRRRAASWGPVLGRLRNLTSLCARSAVALASADDLRLLPASLQHLEIAVLSPADGKIRDIGESVEHLAALRTLRLRGNMRRLTIRESAFEAGEFPRPCGLCSLGG